MSEETTRSPQQAPSYALHRYLKEAVDGATPNITDERKGINMQHQTHAHIQVVPTGGANPSVQVMWWSAKAGKFIDEHTPITKAGLGANLAYEFDVEPRGRIMFVAVTTGIAAGGEAWVFVSGFNDNRT